jgi:hypothetical protein
MVKYEISNFAGKTHNAITHRSLEDEEYMRVIMSVKGLASIAKIFWTISASEPFTVDSSYATVAHSGGMYQ